MLNQITKHALKNAARLLMGKSKKFDVKIERNEKAKQYPLMTVKKDGDVGFDLISTEDVIIPAITEDKRKAFIAHMAAGDKEAAYQLLPRGVIPTGIKIEMSNDIWCSIEARSSSSAVGLITPDSIIDSGYRGELFSVVFNLGYTDYMVKAGDRISQIIFHERIVVDFNEVDKVGESARGESGFGSTGN